MEMKNTGSRLVEAEEIIKLPSFRKNRGPDCDYFIFPYPAGDELSVREWLRYMERKYSGVSEDYKITVFDLYDIVTDILKTKGYLDKCREFERAKGYDRIVKAVGNTLRLTSSDSLIIGYIKEHTEENSVIFLSGIGKCYPLVRSHTVLNNLHQVIDSVPVVMFYPGRYEDGEFILFGEIKDDNYYRASILC